MIIGCVSVWNEAELLGGCLETLARAGAERIVVLDGVYETFLEHGLQDGDGLGGGSVDGTEGVTRGFGAEWIGAREWVCEAEKRNVFFGLGRPGDWYVVVDADERMEGRLPEFVSGRRYVLRIEGGEWRAWGLRIFEHAGRLRYAGANNAVWLGMERLMAARAERVPEDVCRLVHRGDLRRGERVGSRARYNRWMVRELRREEVSGGYQSI